MNILIEDKSEDDMVLVNLQVKHKTFGIGTIISMQGKYITVNFDGVQKNFVYPDSFERFLTLSDGTVSKDILDDLAASQEKKQQILDKKREENVRSMTHGIVIPGKEVVNDSDDDDRGFKSADSDEV